MSGKAHWAHPLLWGHAVGARSGPLCLLWSALALRSRHTGGTSYPQSYPYPYCFPRAGVQAAALSLPSSLPLLFSLGRSTGTLGGHPILRVILTLIVSPGQEYKKQLLQKMASAKGLNRPAVKNAPVWVQTTVKGVPIWGRAAVCLRHRESLRPEHSTLGHRESLT